jgi:hypothetical protein
MKRVLFAILALSPLAASAQDLYITGGYSIDNPRIKDGIRSGYDGWLNGESNLNNVRQAGFFAGLGVNLKAKKASSLGLRLEAAYERTNFEMQTTVRAQLTPFHEPEEFDFKITESNTYIRLSPTLSYYKLRRSAMNYQVDLGLSQFIHVTGWRDNSSFTAIHVSAGIGYGGILFKAGADLGMGNMLAGEDEDFNVRSRRFFAGVNIYPFMLIAKRKTAVPVEEGGTLQ